MPEKKKGQHSRVCLGTGLIALDLVANGDEDNAPRVWAGGSCGNVLTILAYLGWKAYPVARLGKDAAAKALAKDMGKHGVDLRYVVSDAAVDTPIVLQRILVAQDGHPTHRFYWTCPNCGSWLPRYSRIRLQDLRLLWASPPRADCYFFDRVCPASLRLAKKAREHMSLIVFEPTSIKEDPLFSRAMAVCDVLKYSNERAKKSPRAAYESAARLVVETLGSEGLRYRLRKNGRCGEWNLLPAFRVRNLRDAAGAGDWCTAGIIDLLAGGARPFDRVGEEKIVDALRYGQALSALNCGFEGARGAMYGIEKARFKKEVQSILDRKEACAPAIDVLPSGMKKKAGRLCPACRATSKRGRKRET